MILVGGTKETDIIYVQAYILLKSNGVNITQVSYIRNGSSPISEEILSFWKDQNIQLLTKCLNTKGEFRIDVDYYQIEAEVFEWYHNITAQGQEVFMLFQGGHAALNMALQRAANLFGCFTTFQMYYDGIREQNPKTLEEVNLAFKHGKIVYIENGSERGWPSLRQLQKSKNLYNIVKSIQFTIESSSADNIANYPFECLSLLPLEVINWLNQSFTLHDEPWVLKLPKTDLHCHMGGFAVEGEALMAVRQAALNDGDKIGPLRNIAFPDEWPRPAEDIPLKEYFSLGDNTGSYLLYSLAALEKQIELMYDHFISQELRYVEVRCSPYNYAKNGTSITDVISTIMSTFNRCMNQANKHLKRWCHVNLIIIATRKEDRTKTDIEKHLRLAIDSESSSIKLSRCKVVGVDMAGYEVLETRAAIYSTQFEPVNRAGILITIHAGENDESEGIWQALLKLNARRIGHGLNINDDPKLLKWIVNHRIGIEMCPYANYQIKGFFPKPSSQKTYPLKSYLMENVNVSINTDNIGISKASITDNYLLASEMNPDLTRMDILQLIRNSVEQAFVDRSLRITLLKIFNEDIYKLMLNKVFEY